LALEQFSLLSGTPITLCLSSALPDHVKKVQSHLSDSLIESNFFQRPLKHVQSHLCLTLDIEPRPHVNLQNVPRLYFSQPRPQLIGIVTAYKMAPASALPLEVWSIIATVADPNDLANLRLASKGLCTAATRPFGLSRLAHRRFIVSPYSLQGLVQLTAHPVLAPCMKSISLGTYRLNDEHERRPVESHDTDTNDAAHLAAVTQCSFEGHGHCLGVLKRALTNLKHRQIRIGLGIHDDLVHDHCFRDDDAQLQDPEWTPTVTCVMRRAYGFGELYGRLDLTRVGRREVDRTLMTLYHATKQSTYDLNALSLDLGNSFYRFREGTWGTVLHSVVKALVVPKGSLMPVIDLTIMLCADPTGHNKWESDSVSKIRGDRSMEIVGRALLDNPNIAPDYSPIPYALYTIALRQNYFEKIVLKDCTMDPDISSIFIRRHSNTLRHLEVRGLYLRGHDHNQECGLLDLWRDLLKIHSLEVLVLENLGLDNMTRSINVFGEVTLRGAEIRVWLQNFILKTGEWLHNSNENTVCYNMPNLVERAP
jgi:hypothetical protein